MVVPVYNFAYLIAPKDGRWEVWGGPIWHGEVHSYETLEDALDVGWSLCWGWRDKGSDSRFYLRLESGEWRMWAFNPSKEIPPDTDDLTPVIEPLYSLALYPREGIPSDYITHSALKHVAQRRDAASKD